jgi:MoaA/NifB/PqqE/SkfB family radical SAM enzyme
MWTDISKDDQINEIDIEGFKIRINDLINNNIMPDYFNSPLVGQWEITRACNLTCIHCYNNSGKKLANELNHKQKIHIANQIVKEKIFRMCISGGEPILCESFWEIAKIFSNGHVSCNTITNGWFVNESNIDKYTKYFRHIQVSIDGGNPKTHDKIRGKKGSFVRAINTCKLIAEKKGNHSIASVISSLNVNELEIIIDLAYELEAKELRLDVPRLVGRASIISNDLVLNDGQMKKLERVVIEKQIEYEDDMNIRIGPKKLGSYIRSFSKIPPMIIYISPTGTCAPDPILPFSGGSLKEKTLWEIWSDLKNCHKNKEYIRLSRLLKTGNDFINLDQIPYAEVELHDK